MTWTRTPQEYPDRADVLAVPRSARWLLMEMYSWANAQLTDGRVPRSVLRRISDSDDLDGDVDALLREGLLTEGEAGALWLDWTHQEAAETVTARAARNVEKTKRARDRKERHLAGDHSACVAPYCKLAPSVTGNKEGNATGNEKVSNQGKDTGKVTGSFTHIRSDPIRSVRSKGEERIRAGADSAGAPSGPAPHGGLYAQERLRHFRSLPAEWLGADPAALTDVDLVRAVYERTVAEDRKMGIRPQSFTRWALEEGVALEADGADPAESLEGLIPAGGAGR